MNNLLSYCGLVDVRINASDKDLPVPPYIFDGIFQEIQQKPVKPFRPRKERNETGSHAYDRCCCFPHLQHFGTHYEYSRSL